jgi:hypothetical protein
MTPEEIRALAPVGTVQEYQFKEHDDMPEPPDGWEFADGRIIDDPKCATYGEYTPIFPPSMQLPGWRAVVFIKLR